LFADPGGRVQAALQALCGDHRHPLGLALTRVEGAMVPDQGCAAFAETPWAFTRLTEVVEDTRGVRSTASLFVGRVPAEGPRTVPWAAVPSTVGLGANAGEVVGGEAPFALSGWLESEQLGRADITVTPGAERNFSFVVPDFGLEDTAYTLHLVARDARGASTETVFAVEILPPGLDAGVYDGGGPIVAQSDSAACTAFGAEGAAPLALLLIALPWLGRRRRVCS
ncbi:MAG: hypothetical protein KC933_09670, partial [Myxococcales bacterium]|nr:hypothetical protein [Myxococcales bacterium]